jgi:hypothetical protein
VLAYGKMTLDKQNVVGKFGFGLLGMYPSMGTTYMQSMINNIRKVNPAIKLSQYVVLNEWTGNTATGTDTYAATAELSNSSWWIKDAGGNRVQWTGAFGNYEVNLTNWSVPNAKGQRWPQWKAEYDTNSLLKNVTGLNYIYIDNVMFQPRYDADHMRVGTNQLRADPTIQSAFRNGYVAYWNALRTLNPGVKLIGNADNDLSYAEYKGKLDGAFLECQMGKTWSIETWGGWAEMMKRYRTALANTISKKDVVFEACGINGANPAQARYGFASVLLEDGYFAYTVSGLSLPYWADEFSAPLGSAAEAPPTAANASGLWTRKYSNGMVLVNPGTSTLSMDVGTGYKHVTGTLDPVVNDGLAVRMVSLPPKSGLVLLKQ